MGEFKNFLESSTIHGVSYIASTNRYARLFWITIVFSGFIGAGILIERAFQSWTQNPVSTTIETMSISEITFPKVTVCPPKNTYTNLNHDLMNIGNKTVDFDLTNETTTAFKLLENFTRQFQIKDYNNKISEIFSFYEAGRARNWYNKNTSVPFGFEKEDCISFLKADSYMDIL